MKRYVKRKRERSYSFHVIVVSAFGLSFVSIFISLFDPKTISFPPLIPVHLFNHGTADINKVNYLNNDNFYKSIDIISTGTMLKPELQQAQYDTFVSHPAVRNYYRITELNDTEQACSTNLTKMQYDMVQKFCTRKNSNNNYTSKILKLLHEDNGKSSFKPRSIGWLCAQKRPIDGLYNALHPYQISTTSARNYPNIANYDDMVLDRKYNRFVSPQDLPKYLIIMDDDTYMNMTYIVDMLNRHYPNYNEPHILAGCLLRFNVKVIYRFPFGGYGTIITRKVMEKLIRPIYCHGKRKNDSIARFSNNENSNIWNVLIHFGFSRNVCRQLQQNLIGELAYFRDGMSILDLMHAFSSKLSFTKVESWANGTGYCFHSDHALAYFFGYYHIGVSDSIFSYYNPFTFQTARYKRRRGYGYNILVVS